MTEGPCDHHGPADDQVVRDGSLAGLVQMDPGVRRIGPVVTHHKEPPLGDGHLEPAFRGHITRVQIPLVQRRAVDRHPAVLVAAGHRVAADADHPLDQILLVLGRQQSDPGQELLGLLDDDRILLRRLPLVLEPTSRVLEHHHIAARRLRTEPRCEFVHQHPVADPDRLLHRARRDHKRLDQKGLEHQGDHQRHPDQDRDLLHGRAAPPALDAALDLAPLRAPAQTRPRTRRVRAVHGARAGDVARTAGAGAEGAGAGAAGPVPGPSAVTHVRRPGPGPVRAQKPPGGALRSSGRPASRSSRRVRSPCRPGPYPRPVRRDGPVSPWNHCGGPP
jgi:hypothetical protein